MIHTQASAKVGRSANPAGGRTVKGWVAIGVLTLLLHPAVAAEDRGRGDELTRFMAKLGYAAVEMEIKHRSMLIVQGRVNARKATLLADTGFAFTTLDAARARELPRLQLGPWETRGYQVTVADLRPWGFNRDKTRHEVHGLLGLELLARMDAIIDYGAQRLFVRAAAR